MTRSDNDLKPEDFAQAAAEAIKDAQTRGFRDAARVLAAAGLCGICAQEDAGGLALGIAFALPIATEAGKLRLHWPLLENLLVAMAPGESPLPTRLEQRVLPDAVGGPGGIEDDDDHDVLHARDPADRLPDPLGHGVVERTALGGERHRDADTARVDRDVVDQPEVDHRHAELGVEDLAQRLGDLLGADRQGALLVPAGGTASAG